MRTLAAVLLASVLFPASAQHKVDPRNAYERLICIVPIIGAGTPLDPRRPLYAPSPGQLRTPDDVLSFASVVSDDGRFAIVELVARDRAAFKRILDDGRDDVTIFQKGQSKRSEIERECRKHKKDFSLDRFGVAVQ